MFLIYQEMFYDVLIWKIILIRSIYMSLSIICLCVLYDLASVYIYLLKLGKE